MLSRSSKNQRMFGGMESERGSVGVTVAGEVRERRAEVEVRWKRRLRSWAGQVTGDNDRVSAGKYRC